MSSKLIGLQLVMFVEGLPGLGMGITLAIFQDSGRQVVWCFVIWEVFDYVPNYCGGAVKFCSWKWWSLFYQCYFVFYVLFYWRVLVVM